MGLGVKSVGLFPFGYGTPVTGAAPADGPSGVRYLNFQTRDYEVDATTRQLKQMPSLRQRVLIRLMTLVGSSTVQPTFGISLPDRMGDGFERIVNTAVRSAFRQETTIEKIMRIDQISTVKLSSGRAQITLIFTDLKSGNVDRVIA